MDERLEKLIAMDWDSAMNMLYQWVKTGVINRKRFKEYLNELITRSYA